MKRKLLVVTNLTSGGRRKNQRILRELTTFLSANNLAADIQRTELDRNAQHIIENQLDSSFTDLVIVGGDSTINEAVNGLNQNIPVTIIPAGTGNDFMKNIPLEKRLHQQFEVITSSKSCQLT